MALTYRNKLRLAAGLAFIAAVGAGIVGGRIVRLGEPGENFWLVFPALLALCGLAFAATLPYWRRLDDVQKNAQLVSWYWGGLAGALIVFLALCAATGVRSEMTKGGLYVVLGQAVAFVGFLSVWKLRHTGPEA